jgi:hypothetical protein
MTGYADATALRRALESRLKRRSEDTFGILLLGTPIGDNGWLAVGWCVAVTVAGYLGAKKLTGRRSG